MDVPDELLTAAVEITRAASGLAARRFLEGVPVSKKADNTHVTPADVEVEELIRSLIAARFPGDGVTGARHPRGAWVEMVNPATWSEELLVALHREVLLLPSMTGMRDVPSGRDYQSLIQARK